MKKIISAILVLLLLSCLLVSCAADPKDIMTKADSALSEGAYKMTSKLKIECDNPDLKAIFDAMSVEIPMIIDGNNFQMEMNMDIGMGIGVDMSYTIIDRTLYMDMSIMGQQVKNKATMTEEQYNSFMSDNGTEQTVSFNDFANMTTEKGENGETVIVCEGITEKGLAELNKTLDQTLESFTEIGLTEFKLTDGISQTIVIKDGKYQSSTLNYGFTMTVSGETISVNAAMEIKYSYDDIPAVVAPADADQYTEMSYDEMVGA